MRCEQAGAFTALVANRARHGDSSPVRARHPHHRRLSAQGPRVPLRLALPAPEFARATSVVFSPRANRSAASTAHDLPVSSASVRHPAHVAYSRHTATITRRQTPTRHHEFGPMVLDPVPGVGPRRPYGLRPRAREAQCVLRVGPVPPRGRVRGRRGRPVLRRSDGRALLPGRGPYQSYFDHGRGGGAVPRLVGRGEADIGRGPGSRGRCPGVCRQPAVGTVTPERPSSSRPWPRSAREDGVADPSPWRAMTSGSE